MKTILKLLLVFTVFSVLKLTGQGIIIDHNCTNIDLIPSDVVQQVKDNIKWQFSGLSHGSQMLCGVLQAEDYNPVFNVEIGGEYVCCDVNYYDPPYLPTTPDALCVYSGACGYRISDWGPNALSCLQTTINDNPALNVCQLCWCAELDSYTAAQVQVYLDGFLALSIANPNVTFVYMTGNAKAGGIYEQEPGYNRYLRNEQIKQWCIDHNQVCFDFADLESWYNGEMAYFIYEATGDTIPVQHPAYAGADCHHVNQLCTEVKGRAVWWMMARIIGWQSTNTQSLKIKLFLQGNYSESGMSTSLNSHGLLPLSQPFNNPPLNYGGNESVLSIPNANIAEWVLIELRDATNADLATTGTIIERKAAFILSNGDVVALDGYSDLQFDQTIIEQLFIVVRHRNHLGIMSSSPLPGINGTYQYDFAAGSGQAYGGINSQIELSTGVWGMIGGDGNLDGIIDNVDKTLTWTNDSGEGGYYSGDFTLNGNVNNQDKNLIWVINYGKISYIP